MAKQLLFDSEAREAIRRGVNKLSRAVVSTLGPRGRNAVLDKGWGGPTITKDGVTVAEEISLENPFENMGAQLVKEVASKTSDQAGDGTTTATLLAESIYGEGLRFLTSGANPADLNRGLHKAADAVVEELKKAAKPVEGRAERVEQVATISANNDPEVGKKIAEAFSRVGKDGVLTVEEGRSTETEVKIVEGMQFDRGFLSPHFVTDPEAMEGVLENPLILIHEDKLSNVTKLLPLLEKIRESGKPLLVIAEEIEGEALATLVVNRLRGILSCCAVKAPGYGDRRRAMLEDLSILTGAKRPVFKDLGIDLATLAIADLGRAKKVRIDADNTTVLEGAGSASEISARAKQIRRQVEETTSDYDKEKLLERLAKLTGGIAQIQVGAATETEAKERKALYEDAHHATRAALEEGIVPGGGVALLRAIHVLDRLKLPGDEAFAVSILRTALALPIRTIAENAGIDGSIVVRRVLREKDGNFGYNALTGEYGDLLAMGVVDPVKVVRTALQNAVSVAGLLLMTDAIVTEKPKEKKKGGRPPGGGMGEEEGMDDFGGEDFD
jgi:chaperonin GroEL